MNNIKIEIIDKLRKKETIDNPPTISKSQFDSMVNMLINENDGDTLWLLCITYDQFNYNKVINYYINCRDNFNLVGLISALSDNINHEYLVEKLLETKDKNFIIDTLNICGKTMQYSIKDSELEKLLDYIKS